jgi:acetylglutamate kinase
MLHLVKRCIRDDIWPHTIFLTETCIEVQNMTDHPGFENSVIGKLLRRTRQTHLDVVKRVIFWQKHSREIQKELNQLKTNRTKSIKDELFKGKYLHG